MAASALVRPAPQAKWVTAAALTALAANHKSRRGVTFTIEQLRKWDAALAGDRAMHAADKLKRLEFVRSVRPGCYELTADGAVAVKAAAAGQVLKSGQHGPKNRPPAPDSFAARLWALLRARKVIDSGTAAATLLDAGQDVAAGEIRAQSYLRKWERLKVVAASHRRLPNGRKQYVLTQDAPNPPVWEQVRTLPAARQAGPASQ